ncbi:MAG: redoxin domain-containing protein, partial [Muribaculaceae bacterium]|nr:redoxin domain-containing protein [Muribaculaceae bacterium]
VGETAPAVIELEKGAALPAAPGKLVVVDFNATWCGPCKQFAPNFEAVAEKYADKALFYSVDVDQHPELAAQYNVQSIPMVLFIRTDGQTATSLGFLEEAEFDTLVASQLD